MRNLLLFLALTVFNASAADVLLSGSVGSASGAKLAGVPVSAKPEGGTLTTTVYTDESGAYYFTPLPAGRYSVWAKGLGYKTSKTRVELSASRRQDFRLARITDPEQAFRQLPGSAVIAALPEATEHDKRMKRLVRNDCTSCHTASYPLQFRFDEAGWSAIIEAMKHFNVGGAYLKERAPNGLLGYHQKELAAYLAKVRGPGASGIKVKPEPPLTGEAARVLFREYDLPLDPDQKLPANFVQNDGSDWSLGTPSVKIPGWGVHDAWLDFDGNLWFTCNVPNQRVSIGKVDTRSGEVKLFKVAGKDGLAAQTHGMTRTPDGLIWFNLNPQARAGIGHIDPKTEKIDVFIPPQGMSPTGGATTIDYDGKGRIWVSAPDGALRFDPDTQKFTEYKTKTLKTPNGTALTYGAAADRNGNGYWAVMIHDIVGVGDGGTPAGEPGRVSEVKLAPVRDELERVTPEARKVYETYVQQDFNVPLPWAQGPRRMGTDKNADVLWVGNSWGGSLARIDTRTLETSYVALPGDQQAYHVHVDSQHRPWTNLWSADRVLRYDPASASWTSFDIPTRGAEPRYVSVDERDGRTQVVLPYFRARKVAVMTLRSEAEIRELKERAAR
jgi:streptogramin lyase